MRRFPRERSVLIRTCVIMKCSHCGGVPSQIVLVCLSMRVSICVHVLSSLSMAAGSKRELREYDVSGLNEEVKAAVVHGRVLAVSPIKCSKKNDKMKYFDCSLTDGDNTCRLVSFDPHIRPELEDCMVT